MASIISRAAYRYIIKQSGIRHSSGDPVHMYDIKRGTLAMWKKLSLFVAMPCVVICAVNAYIGETTDHHERPEFVPYEYLHIQNKKFPWGDGTRSLFHNPKLNSLPTGYEDEGH